MTKIETVYKLCIGDLEFEMSFDSFEEALEFGKMHKSACDKCASLPITIEKMTTTIEIAYPMVEYYDE